MSGLSLALGLFYVASGRVILKYLRRGWRHFFFALLNLAGVFWVFFYGRNKRELTIFPIYITLVMFQYLTMRIFAGKNGWKVWLAFFTPLAFLVLLRYVPASVYAMASPRFAEFLRVEPGFSFAPYFVGLSYLAFRSSHLVLEIRSGAVEKPGFWEYLSFCFFLPTMSVGPISPYQAYRHAFGATPPSLSIERSLVRIIVGLVKFHFLGKLCDQLTYSGLLLDDHYHRWTDLPVAAVFYYLYLYCNFSGICDLAIGAAGLMGICVEENFNHPFSARNVRDFWNRWHMTLTNYMKEVVFAPLSKWLVHWVGPAGASHAVAFSIAVVFILVGVWHGLGWNYFLFGCVHAAGCVANHYYTVGLKRWLGRDGFKAYNSNRWIHGAAVGLTFCYVAATMFFFANSVPEMKEILSSLR